MKDVPKDSAWYKLPDIGTKDQYQFFLDAGPVSNLNSYFEYEKLDNVITSKSDQVDDVFWKEIIDHPNYDSVWKPKGLIQNLKHSKSSVATMIVGGLFDAEDLYGPFETYKAIEKNNPDAYNTMVFGPWDHDR